MDFNPRKIAIVIALFNNEDEIERSALSALRQTAPDGYEIEVIVVDDCSTDRSIEVAQSLTGEHSNLTVLQMSKNGGPSAARNVGLERTDAAWFSPLDSDDAMEPDRIAKLIAHAEALQADFVADNLLISQSQSPYQVERLLWPNKPDGPVMIDAATFIDRCYGVEIDRSELGYVKPLINRRCLAEPVRPYSDDLRFGEDFDLYTRLLLDGAAAYVVEPCGYYFIQRELSASRSQSGADHRNLLAISRKFLARPGLDRDTRAALNGYIRNSEKQMAAWVLIDGARNRDIKTLLSAFTISLPASLSAASFLLSHPFRKRKNRLSQPR